MKKLFTLAVLLVATAFAKPAAALELGPIAESVVTSNSKLEGHTLDLGIGYGLQAKISSRFGISVIRKFGSSAWNEVQYTPSSFVPGTPGTPSSYTRANYSPSSFTPASYTPEHVVGKLCDYKVIDKGSKFNQASYKPSSFTPSSYTEETPGTDASYTPESLKSVEKKKTVELYRAMLTYELPVSKCGSILLGAGGNYAIVGDKQGLGYAGMAGIRAKGNLGNGFHATADLSYLYNAPIQSVDLDLGDQCIAQVGVTYQF